MEIVPFYPNKRIKMFVIFSLLAISTIVLAYSYFQYVNTPVTRYYGAMPSSQQFEIFPHTEPSVAPQALLRWATMAATSIYTLNFVHYEQMLNNIQKEYFTPTGFSNLMSSLTENEFLSSIAQKQLSLTAVPIEPPVILETAKINGRDAWKIGVKILVNYQTASEITQQSKVITMLVVRVPTTETLKGIGIAQFIATDSTYG